jgi:hypothetical protein
MRRGGCAAVVLVVAACGGQPERGGGTVGGVTDRPRRAECTRFTGRTVTADGDPAVDLYQAYLHTGETARVSRVFELGGVGGVRRLIEGGIQAGGGSCPVLVVVATGEVDQVVPVDDPPVAMSFQGAYDLGGCKRRIALDDREPAMLDAGVVEQLRNMRYPAIAFANYSGLRFYHLHGGRLTQVGELRLRYQTERGSISAINDIELTPGEGGLVARWQDVYHPRDTGGGMPSSPVAKDQQVPLRPRDPAAAQPTTGTRARVAARLGVEPATVGRLWLSMKGAGEWLVAEVTGAGGSQLAVGRATMLYCGGVAVDRMVQLGAGTEVEWVSAVTFVEPMVLEVGDRARDLLMAVHADAPFEVGRESRSRVPAAGGGLALVTRDAAGSRRLHLVSDRHGLVWQSPGAAPARIELARGTVDMPHLLAGGRIYRFDGTRYQLE